MLKTLVKLAVALIIHDMIFLLNLVQGETNYSKEPKVERKTFMNETYVERVLFKAESQNLSEIDNISPKNSSEIDKVPRQLHSKQKNSSGNDNEIVRKLNNEPENVSAIHNVSRQLKGELKKPYEIDNVSRQPTSKPKNSFEINNVTIQSKSDDEAEKIIISAYNMNIKRKIKSKLSQSTLDFMAVVKQNAQYPPMTNKCRLRIVGGKRSSRGDVPYQVCFRRSTLGGSQWSMFCGGSILTRTHVLSAAHCFKTILRSETARLKSSLHKTNVLHYVENYRVTRVIAGTTTSSVRFHRSRVLRDRELKRLQRIEVWRTIKKCHKHRDYDNKKTVNDIAVVELRRPLVFTEFVKPIPMITRSVSAGVNCLCSGYGHMGQGRASDHLQMVCFPIIQDAFCKRLFAIYRGKPTQLCAGTKNKDSCNGDSGGPLVCDGMLAGIVSYGSAKCGTVPGVYTLVSGYTSGKAIPFQTCHAVQLNFNAVEILLALAFIELHVLILFLST